MTVNQQVAFFTLIFNEGFQHKSDKLVWFTFTVLRSLPVRIFIISVIDASVLF